MTETSHGSQLASRFKLNALFLATIDNFSLLYVFQVLYGYISRLHRTNICGELNFFIHKYFKPATHMAILYADRGDRRKSPGVPAAPIAIFADRQYLACQISRLSSPAFAKCARSRDFLHLLLRIASKVNPSGWQFYLMSFQNCHIAAIGEKNTPGVSVSIGDENRLRFSLPIKFAAIGV